MLVSTKGGQGNKRKPGRPPAGPYEGKRKTLSTRITPELRDKLEAASKASGRSLSQEIELRLDRSFETDVQLHEAFGGEHLYALARMIAAILALIESTSGKTWKTDRQTFEEVKAVIDKTLEALGPTAPTAPNDQKLLDYADSLGEVITSTVLGKGEGSRRHTSEAAMLVLRSASKLASGLGSEDELVTMFRSLPRDETDQSVKTG